MFEKKEEPPRNSVSSRGTMTNDDWPIGLLPDGRLNVVNPRAIEDTHNKRIRVERQTFRQEMGSEGALKDA